MQLSFPLRPVWPRIPSLAVATFLGLYSFVNLCAQAPQAPQTTPAAASEAEPHPSPRQIREAQDAYIAGARLLDRGNLIAAEAMFAKAVRLNPEDPNYIQAVALAHEHRVTELVQQAGKARLLGEVEQSQSLLAEARELDPENVIVAQHTDSSAASTAFRPEIHAPTDPSWIQQAPAIAGPVTLLPATTTPSFEVHAETQQTIQQVLSRYGIRAVFDDSVQRQNLRFDLEGLPYAQTAAILFKMAHVFAVPLDPHTVLIANDTTENRQKFERQLEETIYVPGFTPEQMKELGTVVQSVFDVKQATVQNTAGSLVLRAPEDTLTAINLTLADLIDGGAEVLLDLNLYAVDRTRQRDIGVQLPQQIGVYNVETAARELVQANQSLVTQAIAQGLIPADASDITIALALISSGLVQSTLLSNTIGFFGGGITQTGITTTTPTTFHLALNSSDTRALDTLQLRIGDRQTGTFRSGTRYPIITSTYSSGISGSAASLAGTTINGVSATSLLNQYLGASGSVTIPQIQYEDLGLTLKATPTVQKSGLVSVKLDLKIEALAGGSLNNIPVLANRQYASEVTIGDGATALLASTLTRSESAAISGIPGLGELPGFQTATADTTTEKDSSELILLITPHIVRHRSSAIAGPRIAFNQRLPGN
jgi:type II secretory pathway component GspD/PulD (secretin)